MRRVLLAITVLALVLAGCSKEPGEPSARMEPAIQQTVKAETGALEVTVSLDRAKATMIERFVLGIRARPAPGAQGSVVEPDIADAMPLELQAEPLRDVSPGDGATFAWEAEIDPLDAGTHEIKPIEVRLTRAGAEGGETVASVLTPALTVEVVGLLSDDEIESGLADMKGVVEPPEGPAWRAWAIGGGAAVALLAAGTWLLLRRGRDAEAEIVRRPAHEIALERLDRLLASGLIQRGAWKAYYADLSLILRRYIEDRFGLHAPERTTEEFLAESKASASFTDTDVALLEKFLHHCDMVKFAAVEPTESQGEHAAEAVRAFIDRTRSEAALVVVGEGAGVGRGVAA